MRVTTWGPRSFINTRTNAATANRRRLGMFRNTRAGWAIAHSVARRPLQAYTHYNRYVRILFIIIFTAPRTKCSFFFCAHPFLRRAHIYITRIQTCVLCSVVCEKDGIVKNQKKKRTCYYYWSTESRRTVRRPTLAHVPKIAGDTRFFFTAVWPATRIAQQYGEMIMRVVLMFLLFFLLFTNKLKNAKQKRTFEKNLYTRSYPLQFVHL